MSSRVRCLECGFEIPAGRRVCLEPQPTNRKGFIAVGVGFFAVLVVVWIVMQLVGK